MHVTGRQIAILSAIRIAAEHRRCRPANRQAARARMRRWNLVQRALLVPQALSTPQAHLKP
jgi:hypothetical protein